MKCKNLKIKSKTIDGKKRIYGYCKKYDKEVSVYCYKKECAEYKNAQYFQKTVQNSIKNNAQCTMKVQKPIKKRSNKLAKAEKGRYSIIYQDLTKCAVCGSLATELNEVYEGAYRLLSIKYGMVMPMCHSCHEKFHSSRTFASYYKILFEKEFLKTHTLNEWLDVFKIDYRYRK